MDGIITILVFCLQYLICVSIGLQYKLHNFLQHYWPCRIPQSQQSVTRGSLKQYYCSTLSSFHDKKPFWDHGLSIFHRQRSNELWTESRFAQFRLLTIILLDCCSWKPMFVTWVFAFNSSIQRIHRVNCHPLALRNDADWPRATSRGTVNSYWHDSATPT